MAGTGTKSSKGYSGHREYMSAVAEGADRRLADVESALRNAFAPYIEMRQVETIVFSEIGALDLAEALIKYPLIFKPLIAICNIAARAIERDLQIKNLATYSPRLDQQKAAAIAGYIKPFLPPYLELPVVAKVDRLYFIDKEIRKTKGRWEKAIVGSLNRNGKLKFKKRKFKYADEEFEVDAACPEAGPIRAAIDVKRIEARRDIHKRCDEIVNKADKLKKAFPQASFAAIIYYPFIDEQNNVRSRLQSPNIDAVYFASDARDTITNAVKMLLSTLGMEK